MLVYFEHEPTQNANNHIIQNNLVLQTDLFPSAEITFSLIVQIDTLAIRATAYGFILTIEKNLHETVCNYLQINQL